jgi:hypothetical protein
MKGTGSKVSTGNKVQIAVIIVIYAVVVAALACILLEGAVTPVGVVLNKPFVSSYLRKNYSDLGYKAVSAAPFNEKRDYLGVEMSVKGYRYTYKVTDISGGSHGTLKAGDTFTLEAYNYRVTYDEIYAEYACDKEINERFNEKMLEDFTEFAAAEELRFTPVAVNVDLMVPQGRYNAGSVNENLKAMEADGFVNKTDIVLHVTGPKVDYSEYRKNISAIVRFYATGDGTETSITYAGADKNLLPRYLQIVYYYFNDAGEKVMQYESQFTAAELKYTEDMAAAGNDIHYKVELTEKETRKLKAYTVVKNVYIYVLIATVVVLGGLWAVRRVRRLLKEGSPEKKTVIEQKNEPENEPENEPASSAGDDTNEG